MKQILLFVCIGFILKTASGEEEVHLKDEDLYPVKDGYVQLDEHNFVAALHRFKFVLAFYYGDNRESEKAKPELDKIFKRLKSSNSIVHLAKINAEKEHEIVKKFAINALPTFRLFKNGKRYDYAGKLESEKILTWLDLAMAVPLQINTAHELQSLTKTTCVILGCFPGKSPAKAFENFYKVSEYFVYESNMPLPRFALITSAKLAREVGVVSGSITVFKRFEDGAKVVFEGDTKDFEKVLKFVDVETYPVVFKTHISEYSHQMHHKTKDYQHILFMSSDDRHFSETFKNFKKAAKVFLGKNNTEPNEVAFIHVDLKQSQHDEYLSYYHIDVKKDLPCNRMTKFDKYHSRFIPDSRDFSYDCFKHFTLRVLDGKIKRHIRSEPVPKDWNNYDVKVVVGKTYDDFVDDNHRTVMMLYYIPNDSASEAAIPVFNELAKEFQSNRTIKFGRMNIGLNDGEVGDILKVPSVKMFLTNGKSVQYKLDIDAKKISRFIMTAGTNQPLSEDEIDDSDYEFVRLQHPVESVEYEERRKKEWEEEEKRILSTAVKHEVGEEPHDNEKYIKRHPLHHLPLEERDPKYMDPQKHVDFENMHKHEHDHTIEL